MQRKVASPSTAAMAAGSRHRSTWAASRWATRLTGYLKPNTYLEPLLGPSRARANHAAYRRAQPTVEAALQVIRRRWPDFRGSQASAPVFILSAGWRSGSTLLQRWLMTDPRMLIWGEPYKFSQPIQSLARQIRPFALASWPDDSFFPGQHRATGALTRQFVGNLYASFDEFVAAHLAYFDRLFVQPTARFGRSRWGLKEISLTVDEALYLKWLFPRARFLFLYRNPYDAYRSYRQWRDWYVSWPDQPVFTPVMFGRCWRHLVEDFRDNYHKVGGLALRYEELKTPETRARLSRYLDLELADPTRLPRVRDKVHVDAAESDDRQIPRLERYLLRRAVQPLAARLGYR